MQNKIKELEEWLKANGLRLEVSRYSRNLCLYHIESGASMLMESDDEGVIQFDEPFYCNKMYYEDWIENKEKEVEKC